MAELAAQHRLPGPASPAWPHALPVVLAGIAWIIYCYRDTAAAMVTIWARSDTFAHGFIVPPIALWLIWRQRQWLAQLTPHPRYVMLWPMLIAGFAWLLGELSAVAALTQLAFTILLVLAVPAILGLRLAANIAFPLAFFLLAVPMGEFALPHFMDWTAKFTVLALRLSGIPVYQEGLQFVIPTGNWSVVEACSGVRYLIASFTVGTLFAYLNYRSLRRRLIFMAVSIVVPVVANWARAYLIVLLGHLSGNKLAAGVDHLIYGWFFFGVVIMIMFMIGARWSEDTTPDIALPPVRVGEDPEHDWRGIRRWWPLLVVALVTALPQLVHRYSLAQESTLPARLDLTPFAAGAGGWTADNNLVVDWKPVFANPSSETRLEFVRGEQRVGVYLGYYRNQDYQRKLVTSTNVIVRNDSKEWARVAQGQTEVRIGDRSVMARVTELRNGTRLQGEARLIFWQWYWINGRLTARDDLAKAYTSLSRLIGQGDDSAVVFLYASKEDAEKGALDDFARTLGPAIEASLARTRAQR